MKESASVVFCPSGALRVSRIPAILSMTFLFVLSGASGLIYEILWMRMFTQVFGSTTAATSTVLSAFMAGLALGSYLIGSYADSYRLKPLTLYAYLEGAIGIFGLLMPFLLQHVYSVYQWIFLNFQGNLLLNLARFALSFLLILIPSALMGGTLPVLSRYFVQSRRELCRWVGLLYGVNTLGAVIGSFLSGFFLVGWLGVRHTGYVAVAINFAIALLALFIGTAASKESGAAPANPAADDPDEGEPTAGEEHKNIRRLLLLVCFFSGFTSLACEVMWTRLLVFVLDSTVYAFSTMLTTFLLGIAIGGFLISALSERVGNSLRWLGGLQIGVGLSGFATIVILAHMPAFDSALRSLISQVSYGGWWTSVSLKFIEAFLIMFVQTVLMGMSLPLICRIYTNNIRKLSGSIGVVYALNTCGAVIGSLLAGFVMIPSIGSVQSLAVTALIATAVGSIVLFSGVGSIAARRVSMATVGIAACAGLLIISPHGFSAIYNMHERGSRLAYFHEGRSGTVTIHIYPQEERLISVNGTNVAGTQFSLRTTQKLQAHIPMLLHGRARNVLQIGFGSGESCHVLSLYPLERIDLVEIDPDVLKTSDTFFSDLNQGIVHNPLFHPIIMDGKNYALLTEKRYDVVMNDSTFPGKGGSSCLYTRDHFLACRRLLNDGGVMSSWVPFELRPQEFQSIVKTFQSVFPYTTLWLANNCRNKHALLVGTVRPFAVDFERVEELMNIPAVKADLQSIDLASPFALLGAFSLDPDAAEAYSQHASLNSDDHPTLEFCAGRYPTQTGYWAANHADFLRFRSSIIKYLRFPKMSAPERAAALAAMQRQERANIHIDKARLYELMDEAQGNLAMFGLLTLERREEYEKALGINPGDVNVKKFLSQGDTSLALLEELAAKQPDNAEVLYNLGRAYRGCRKYQAAIDSFTKAASLDNTNGRYSKALSIALNESNLARNLKPSD